MGDDVAAYAEVSLAIARLEERMKSLETQIDGAHKRIDKNEGEIKEALKDLRDTIEPLRDALNRAKGGLLVLMLIGSVAGSFFTLVAQGVLGAWKGG